MCACMNRPVNSSKNFGCQRHDKRRVDRPKRRKRIKNGSRTEWNERVNVSEVYIWTTETKNNETKEVRHEKKLNRIVRSEHKLNFHIQNSNEVKRKWQTLASTLDPCKTRREETRNRNRKIELMKREENLSASMVVSGRNDELYELTNLTSSTSLHERSERKKSLNIIQSPDLDSVRSSMLHEFESTTLTNLLGNVQVQNGVNNVIIKSLPAISLPFTKRES